MTAASLVSGAGDCVCRFLRLFAGGGKPPPSSYQAAKSPAANPPAARNGKKVLIGDDDAIILQTTSLKLRSKGYAVITALDASGVIGAVRDESPDLILLDINFPPDVAHGGAVAWDGFVLMSWLRQFAETRRIPIIIITGQKLPSLEERSLRAGARAFFQKPIDHERLLAVIRRTLFEDAGGAQSAFHGDFHA